VDLALNHLTLSEAGYGTIHQLLAIQGYYQKPDSQPFQYYRSVSVNGKEIAVEVDSLAGEYGGTAQSSPPEGSGCATAQSTRLRPCL
jgi:hypothetical protein